MTLEEEVFQKKRVNKETLIPYGFQKEGKDWLYRKAFYDGAFEAYIRIDEKGYVSGKVIDTDSGEEYIQIRLSLLGTYSAEVKEAYLDILEDIAEHCFVKRDFYSDQAVRLAEYLKERYGEEADHPFQRLPECAVFRCPENAKWYGLIMRIEKKKVYPKEKSDEKIETLDLKVLPSKREEYLQIKGVFLPYHMNKKNWLTVVLDETVDDETLRKMIRESRDSVVLGNRKSSSASNIWIVPANPKYYDIERHFEERKDVIWKQGSRIQPGDIVYMYIAAPVSAIRYKCLVKKTDIPYRYKGAVSMKKIMSMDVLEIYEEDLCPFPVLKRLGITAIRGQRTATKEFCDFMSYYDTNVGIGGQEDS
ncbi:MAG: MmcQ/YjbR family DNA-binding protein [Erysipelotrichaceae bacterium]|nr:MmcQ/YjbR family DNA-binding protein [Erysipelotrichaceae bacterium]